MQMFFSEGITASNSFQEMRQFIRGVFFISTDLQRVHFLLGFLTTCGQCFIYPDVGNNSNEQPSSEAALTSPEEAHEVPEVAYALLM